MPATMANTLVLFFLSLFFHHVASLGATDTITWGGDNSRTGYQDNHNMDPTIVGSAQFGQIFKSKLPGLYNGAVEQIFSMPLVYTLSDGIQYIFFGTTHNNVYKLDAKTGTIISVRNLHIPFVVTDLAGCVDINPLVGITATGVIDPATETYYLTSKTYANQNGGTGAQGLLNGRYFVHAINLNDLSERPNFPLALEGTVARNNPVRTFGGGIHHQRPALLHTGQYIYAGFASHCVHDNFTGWIMGWDKTTGAIVERFATQGLGVDAQTKGAGVWMSGGGLASDNAGSMFYATGNGYASQLSTIPVNGRNPPTSLEEAAVHMSIAADGSLSVADFFMPWEKTQLDGADRDLGTTPLELLPAEFSCGEYKRIGVVTGKSGKTYFLNLDDLGGYQNGPNKLDKVIFTYQNENSVYAGAGVYPGEGGYIYINVINYPSRIFKFSCSNGAPGFTPVAATPEPNAFSGLGVSHGTTTSMKGAVGSGLYWITDVNGFNLRIYNAVPNNGLLTVVNKFNIPGVTKFSRPVFGNGRAYIATNQGYLYGFGAPVNLPLNCTSPYDFGTTNLAQTSAAKTITCKALIGVTVSGITLTGNPDFTISGLPALPLTVAAGATFSFQGVFNPTNVGILSSDVVVATTNGVTGYSVTTPISLKGVGQSVAPRLAVSPVTVAFQGLIAGQAPGGVNQTVLFLNSGNTRLDISSIQYSQVAEEGPFIQPNITGSGVQVGPFTFYNIPASIAPNDVATVTINFDTAHAGNFGAYLTVNSNGGNKIFDVVGTAGDVPTAVVEFQTPDGLGWVKYTPNQSFTFGNVTENQTRSLKLRITNNATANAASLSLTISKAPFGSAGIINANNQIDLAEGTTIPTGKNATATLYCSVPKVPWNTPSYSGSATWEMNFNDPTFGHQTIKFACNAVAEQSAPRLANGSAQYRYAGCYQENNPGRQLKSQIYGSDASTTEMCTQACAAQGFLYCGTQYNRECWGGPTIPNLKVDERNCNFPCKGDINQICGGNGFAEGAGKSYISLFVDSLQGNGQPPPPPPPVPSGGPVVNPGVSGYSSIGCYTESTTGRALPNGKAVASQTVANCVNACAANAPAYKYAGVEYGGECWCGNAFNAGAVPAPLSECRMLCNGNSTEYCGAGQRLLVYQFGASASSSSSSVVSSTTTSQSSTSSQVTTSTTSSLSSSSTSPSSSSTSVSSTSSSLSSSSTSSSSSSSVSPTSSSESLSSSSTVSSSSSSVSPTTTSESQSSTQISTSSIATSSVSSTDFTSQTSSSSLSSETSALTSSADTSSSSVTSSSSSSSISSTTSSQSSSSSSSISSLSTSSTTSGSTTITSTTSSVIPTRTSAAIDQTIDYWTFKGCWTESTTGRALSSKSYADDTMTLDSCATYCKGFQMFGVEYGRECYCGNTLAAGSIAAADQKDCNFLCPGNKLQYCGAGKRLQLYTATASPATSPSTPSGTATPSSTSVSSGTSSSSSSTSLSSTSSAPATYTGPPVVSRGNSNYTYYSCASEPQVGRLLPSQILNDGIAMTIEACLTACDGFQYIGVEYGRECWCGNVLNTAGNGGTPTANLTDSQCNFKCPGNSSEFCGAGGKMNLYWYDDVKAKSNAAKPVVVR